MERGNLYLKKFVIRNFRAIEELKLDFHKGLNIIVGENNSAKTAIVDALRLCLSDFQHPKDIYCSVPDFRVDKNKINDKIPDITFDLIFEPESPLETAWFNDLLAVDENCNSNLQLHFRYELVDYKSTKKVRRSVWGGNNERGKVSYEVRSALRNVYLSALRNTNKDLKPIKGNILSKLYSNLINEDFSKDDLLEQMTGQFKKNKLWQEFVKNGQDSILDHLDHLSYLTDDKRQIVEVGFAPYEFDKFVQNLIFQLPVYTEDLVEEDMEQIYFDISQNGLGYNNIIYTAAVLGDIKQRNAVFEEEYNLLLIEEPEAHLHPQLQNIFFNYLKTLNKQEEFQIIVTSHSPTIAAKTDLKLLTVLQNYNNNIFATQINDLGLGDSLKFLQKFLDVTKSQLFFSNGVILVEGISEALLLPIFSKILGKEEGQERKYDVENHGIEVVNINGVAFEHFAKLFNSNNEKRLKCRCAIVTDDDHGKKPAKQRIESTKSLKSGNLNVFPGHKTFEYELFINNFDNACLLETFRELKHTTNLKLIKKLIQSNDIEKAGDCFVQTLVNAQHKSEFSYLLAFKLENDSNYHDFKVPEYIENAIKYVVVEG